MATANFPIPDFYTSQYKTDNKWQSAALIAFGLHFAVLLWAMFLPDIFNHKPLLEEAVIIDLVSVAPPEPAPVEPTPAPQVKSEPETKDTQQVEKQPEPVVAETKEPEIVIPDPVEQQVEPPPTPVKPISVNPVKRKKKLASDTRLAEERERERRAAKIKKEAEAKKRQERVKQEQRRQIAAEMAEKARLDAQKAAEDARRELAEMYKQQRQINQTVSNNRVSSSRSSSASQLSIVEQQFIANVRSHLTGFWVLPELRNWNLNLKTTVWFTVSKKGELLSYKIVKKSGDPLFDQLVLKTMKKSAPMPPGPNLMKQNSLDFSASFTPGKLIM